MNKISIEKFKQILEYDIIKNKSFLEIEFNIDEDLEYFNCWIGKTIKKENNEIVYWAGLVSNGSQAYEYDTKEELLNAKIFRGKSLVEIWDSIYFHTIDNCKINEILSNYINKDSDLQHSQYKIKNEKSNLFSKKDYIASLIAVIIFALITFIKASSMISFIYRNSIFINNQVYEQEIDILPSYIMLSFLITLMAVLILNSKFAKTIMFSKLTVLITKIAFVEYIIYALLLAIDWLNIDSIILFSFCGALFCIIDIIASVLLIRDIIKLFRIKSSSQNKEELEVV